MHLVVRSAIVFARIGLYISLSADDCLARGGCFIIDRLIDVMRFVLSILSSTWLSRVKSASDRSKVVKFLERSVSVAMSALFPPNPWSPKYVNLGALRIRWFSISISSQGFALHTQSGITKEVVWALRMFSMTGFVIRWPRIVMFFHSFGVRVISQRRWLVVSVADLSMNCHVLFMHHKFNLISSMYLITSRANGNRCPSWFSMSLLSYLKSFLK